MLEILLGIVAAELGYIAMVGTGILGLEFYAMWIRARSMAKHQQMMQIPLSPDELEMLLASKNKVPATEAIKGQYA